MNSRFMPAASAAVLVHLMSADQPMNYRDIGFASGLFPNGTDQTWAELGASLVRPVVNLGAAAKVARNPLRFEITEKGRIAVALFRAIANRKEGRS